MPEGRESGRREGFRFRRLDKPEEYRSAEEIGRANQAAAGEPAMPAPMLRDLQDHGGLVLGAYADIHLAGYVASFLGWDGTTLYQFSPALSVRPEYQNHHVGLRLMAYLREEVLGQGLSTVRWGFDPLASRAAHLAVRRLGVQVDRYLVHHYGRASADGDPEQETDRLAVRWALTDPGSEARLGGAVPSADELLARLRRSQALVETEVGDSGLRVPRAVAEPSGAEATIEIPFDLASIRAHEPGATRIWRHAVRDAFRIALDAGYAVQDFAVVAPEHERRSLYFLGPAPPSGALGAPSPPPAGSARR